MDADPAGAARRAADSPVVDRVARVGFAARGTTYLLMGWIALQLGLGHHPRQQANQKGAFQELAQQPDGPALLWLLVVGLACYAVYRLVDAVWGGRGEPDAKKRVAKRVGSAFRAGAYAVLTYGAWAVLQHRSSSAGEGSGAGLMQHSYGRWLVAAIGAGLVIGGVAQVASGITRRFEKHLKTGQMGPRTRRVVEAVGIVGTTGRGVVFAVIGWFFLDAARTFDPKKAEGLDQSLRELVGHGGGRAVLVAIALGLLAFGLYSWCEARWRRTGKEGRLSPGHLPGADRARGALSR
ncbi:uncharacterized protein DUF1206 [Motilibacter rhizosphaerae]|uniref:Uncharacterized protein DUF1206 n=1 Tax=Motilibacter rhizosphaerae TaxID=598652 RepID=A0A4Q7NT16_9ACTN|nr:DUF1206 domain-containing protein [Motilibacter rhizosphaerae]RZS90020.1 uncharacterized protein DUF1206 [Motilibacter rhizosphaerae]